MKIPNELLMEEILNRLPVNALQRLRQVCKSLYSTISSPSFIVAHDQSRHRHGPGTNATTSILELYHTRLSMWKKKQIFHSKPYTNITVMEPIHLSVLENLLDVNIRRAYSKGLLCFFNPMPQDPNAYCERIILWNPIFGKILTLKCDSFSYGEELSGYSYVNEFVVFGFGYDKTSCDYKVIRATLFKPKRKRRTTSLLRANVYSLNANTWKSFDVSLPYRVAKVRGKRGIGVQINGIMYWTFGRCLLAFDLKDEVFYDLNVTLPNEIARDLDLQIIPVKLKLLAQERDEEKEEDIKLGLIREIQFYGFAVWVLMDSESTGKTMSWSNCQLQFSASWLMNCLDVRMVNAQITLEKSRNGKYWVVVVDHLKSESETYASHLQNSYKYPTRLVVSFEESLALAWLQ